MKLMAKMAVAAAVGMALAGMMLEVRVDSQVKHPPAVYLIADLDPTATPTLTPTPSNLDPGGSGGGVGGGGRIRADH